METELILSIGGLPPLSARGCIQELAPVKQGSLRRTINGELIYVGSKSLKYRSNIHCEDKTTLATEGLEPGSLIKVGCIQRLWQKVESAPTNNEPISLERTPIAESITVMDEEQNLVPIKNVQNNFVYLKDRLKTYYISYRPWLDMCVLTYKLYINEWGLKAGWRLELEEV